MLILGESGTGKEMVARAIHQSGRFRDKPFMPVDCGAGFHAHRERAVRLCKRRVHGGHAIERRSVGDCDGGTVFLDEVGELPVDLQAKLLRTLQEKEIRPLGSKKRIPINVRILAATNRNL